MKYNTNHICIIILAKKCKPSPWPCLYLCLVL